MRRASRRGSALILTLFLLIVLQFLGMAFLTRVQGEMAQTTRDVTSYYITQSALEDTRAWLEQRCAVNQLDNELVALPTGTDPNAPATMNTYYERTSSAVGAVTPPGWTWRVRIYPDPFTRGNSNLQTASSVHGYQMVMDAIEPHSGSNGMVRRRAVAWVVQKQFNDGWAPLTSPGDLWLDLTTFRIKGPFHTNAALRLNIPSWDWEELGPNNDGSTAPFQQGATFGTWTSYSSGDPTYDGIEYHTYSDSILPFYSNSDDGPVGSAVPLSTANKTRYNRISAGGQNSLRRVDPVTVPQVSSLMAEAAWGSDQLPNNPRSGFNINPGPANGSIAAGNTSVPINKNTNGVILAGPDVRIMQLQVGNDSEFPVSDTNMRGANNDNASILIRQGTGGSAKVRRITQTYSQTSFNPGGTYTINGVSVSGATVLPAPGGLHPDGFTIVQNDVGQKSYEIYDGTGNGLIYSLPDNGGNILGLEGKNKGRHTIAVSQGQVQGSSVNGGREIRITDSLLRDDTAPGSSVAEGATRDQLGLVGYAVRFTNQRTEFNGSTSTIDRSQWTDDDPLYLYVAMFAGLQNDPNGMTNGGGVGTIGYNQGSPGVFRLYGSMTENVRQAKGQFNSSGPTHGFSYQFEYDNNMTNMLPPYYPAEPSFEVKSWRDQPMQEDAS